MLIFWHSIVKTAARRSAYGPIIAMSARRNFNFLVGSTRTCVSELPNKGGLSTQS